VFYAGLPFISFFIQIIFSPTVEEFGGSLSVEGVTEFIDNGGNVLIAGNSNTGDILREIARYVRDLLTTLS
jgi:hypothetical protein